MTATLKRQVNAIIKAKHKHFRALMRFALGDWKPRHIKKYLGIGNYFGGEYGVSFKAGHSSVLK